MATEELVVPPAAEGEKVQSGINLFNRWSYDEIQNHRELGGDGVATHYGAARFGDSGQRQCVFRLWWFDGQLTAKVRVRRWKQVQTNCTSRSFLFI